MKIYIKLEGHEFQYEIEDVLKLFFEEMNLYYEDPGEDYRGILLYSAIDRSDTLEEGRRYHVKTLLKVNGQDVLKESQSFLVSLSEDKNFEYEERKIQKREIKRQVYNVLSQYTGTRMP